MPAVGRQGLHAGLGPGSRKPERCQERFLGLLRKVEHHSAMEVFAGEASCASVPDFGAVQLCRFAV